MPMLEIYKIILNITNKRRFLLLVYTVMYSHRKSEIADLPIRQQVLRFEGVMRTHLIQNYYYCF